MHAISHFGGCDCMKLRLIALASILAIGFGQAARADDRKDIEALYARLVKAFKAKDADAVIATATKGFTYKSMNGKTQNAADAEAGLRKDMASWKSMDMTMHLDKVTIKGNDAVV